METIFKKDDKQSDGFKDKYSQNLQKEQPELLHKFPKESKIFVVSSVDNSTMYLAAYNTGSVDINKAYWNNGVFSVEKTYHPLLWSVCYCLVIDSDNTLYCATDNGVIKILNSCETQVNPTGQRAKNLCIDDEGFLYFCDGFRVVRISNDGTMSTFFQQTLENYWSGAGLEHGTQIIFNKVLKVFYILDGTAIKIMDKHGKITQTLCNLDFSISSLLCDPYGRLYAITSSNTIYGISPKGDIQSAVLIDINDSIVSLAFNSNGELFITTDGRKQNHCSLYISRHNTFQPKLVGSPSHSNKPTPKSSPRILPSSRPTTPPPTTGFSPSRTLSRTPPLESPPMVISSPINEGSRSKTIISPSSPINAKPSTANSSIKNTPSGASDSSAFLPSRTLSRTPPLQESPSADSISRKLTYEEDSPKVGSQKEVKK